MRIKGCRISGSSNLIPILDLGTLPLANSLLNKEQLQQSEKRFPLDVVFCPESALLQLTETVPPEELFSHYLYFSSFADTVVENAKQISESLISKLKLGPQHLAVEIASNDGYLLKNYKAAGVQVLGIEPATNIAKVATENGINTINEFFGADIAAKLAAEGKRADVFHANNVLAHVSDLNGVAKGISLILKDFGVASIEVPYVRDLIDHVEFDTIYHEHLCYFSLIALENLFSRHGMRVADVECIPIHGGTLRIFVKHAKYSETSTRALALFEEERKLGLDKVEYYKDFAARVEKLKVDLNSLLKQLKSEGKSIAAYGASAKGSTLMNFCQVGADSIDFVVDRSTAKQGLYTPGNHLPILSPDKLSETKPDYVLLLAWNFKDEIARQQKSYLEQGGKFISPVPTPSIIGS